MAKDDNTVTLDIKTKTYTAADAGDLIESNKYLAHFFTKNPKAALEVRYDEKKPISATDAFTGLASSLEGSQKSAYKHMKTPGVTYLNEVFSVVVTRDKNGKVITRPNAKGTGKSAIPFYSGTHEESMRKKTVTSDAVPLPPHNLGNNSTSPGVDQVAANNKTKSKSGSQRSSSVSDYVPQETPLKKSPDWRFREFGPSVTAQIGDIALNKDSAKKPGHYQGPSYSYFDYHSSIYPKLRDEKRGGLNLRQNSRGQWIDSVTGQFVKDPTPKGVSVPKSVEDFRYNKVEYIPGRDPTSRIGTRGAISYESEGSFSKASSVLDYKDTTSASFDNRKYKEDRRQALVDKQRQWTGVGKNAISEFTDYNKEMYAAKSALTSGSSWVDKLYQLVQRPAASGSAIDAIDRAAKPRLGGGSGSGGSSGLTSGAESLRSSTSGGHGDQGGKSSRGIAGQFGEQFRHAAIWSAYAPILGAGAFMASRIIGGDRYTDKAAHSLIGVGMDQGLRDRSKRWAEDQAILNPYTYPQQHLTSVKETASGLGMDPTPDNMYTLLKAAKGVHHYSSYTRMAPEIAARALSKQSTMVQKVASGYGDKSTATIMNEMASMGASLAKTSPVTGQEIDHAMQVAGPSLMGKEGLNWSPAQTLGFFNTFMSAGLNSSNVATVAKHIGSGMPFVEQMAKTELFIEQLQRNIDKQGAKRAAVPLHLLKGRDYYMSDKTIKKNPEETHMFGNRISEISQLLKSGDQGAIMNRLQQYGIETNYIMDNFPKGRNFINQTDVPFAQFMASMPKGQPAQDVVDSAKKLQGDQNDLNTSEARTFMEREKSASLSSLGNAFSSVFTHLGDKLGINHILDKASSGFKIQAAERLYKEAVVNGDTKEAARYMSLVSAKYADFKVDPSKGMRALYYSGIGSKIDKIAAGYGTSQVTMHQLPDEIKSKLSKEELSKLNTHTYDELKSKVYDLPSVNTSLSGSSDKFSLPENSNISGIPSSNDYLEALKSLPREIAKEIERVQQKTEVVVNTQGAPGATVHTNKSVASPPVAPEGAKEVTSSNHAWLY